MPRPVAVGRRARILYVDHCALMSGGEIALLNLVRTIDSLRFEPIVLLCSEGPLVAALRSAGVQTHIVPLDESIAKTRKDSIGVSTLGKVGSVWKAIKYTQTLVEFMRDQRIDLVHTNSLKADILGGVAARVAGLPLIWHVRDRIADDYLPPMVAYVFRILCRLVPRVVVANSAATLQSVGRKGDDRSTVVYSGTEVRRADLNVIHDGLHASAFELEGTSRQNNFERPVVGLLGRISPWKGQHVFLRAAAIVLRKFPKARFRIIGKVMFDEKSYEAEIHALVAELGITDSIEFVGFRSDVATVLSELTLLVHASTTGEPFGQVIVEGMAAGLPVVATDGGGVPEIVLHGETGLLVPMNDVDAMATAITQILSNPTASLKMGERGQARAQRVFSIERTARAVESIYAKLLLDRHG